jgi:hypothetical protein
MNRSAPSAARLATKQPTFILMGVLLLAGCRGKLVTTVSLPGPGTAEARFAPSSKALSVWADCDAKWTGGKSSKPLFDYDVELLQGGKTVGRVACSTGTPGGQTVCCSTSNIFGELSGDCEYKLGCALPLPPPGETTLRVTSRVGPNVKSVTKMSLNVREE